LVEPNYSNTSATQSFRDQSSEYLFRPPPLSGAPAVESDLRRRDPEEFIRVYGKRALTVALRDDS
jgi:hypothetical protein